VYLLDSNPEQNDRAQSGVDDETDGTCPNESNDPPMKRLRLRGDWSDTGPNARPEGEEPGTSEDSFVQRMSGYLTRWIEESIRNARRQRRQNPTVSRQRSEGDTENHEGNTEETDDGNESATLPGESHDENRGETNSDSDVTEDSDDVTEDSDDVMNNGDDVFGNSEDVTKHVDDVTQSNDADKNRNDITGNDNEVCYGSDKVTNDDNEQARKEEKLPDVEKRPDFGSKSREHDGVGKGGSRDLHTNFDRPTRNQSNHFGDRKRSNASGCRKMKDNSIGSAENAESCDKITSRVDGIHGNDTCDDSQADVMCDGDNTCDETKLQNEASSLESENQGMGKRSKSPENAPPPAVSTRGLSPTGSGEQNTEIDQTTCSDKSGNFSTKTLNIREIQSSSSEKMRTDTVRRKCDGMSCDDNRSNLLSYRTELNKTKNEPSEIETSDVSTRVTIPLGTNTRGSETSTTESGLSESVANNSEDHIGEASASVADESRRDAAASTIQNFFRFRVKKDFQSIPCNVPVHSDVVQVFKGHRNARTMVSIGQPAF
jgi:hypothetical protein